MTTRHLVEVTATELQQLAFDNGGDIEIDTDTRRAYLRIDNTTYVADIEEPTC